MYQTTRSSPSLIPSNLTLATPRALSSTTTTTAANLHAWLNAALPDLTLQLLNFHIELLTVIKKLDECRQPGDYSWPNTQVELAVELPGRFFAHSSDARGFVKAFFAAEGFRIPWHGSRFFAPAHMEGPMREMVCITIDLGRMWRRDVRTEVARRVVSLEKTLSEHWAEI
jgi:hypothetical protein